MHEVRSFCLCGCGYGWSRAEIAHDFCCVFFMNRYVIRLRAVRIHSFYHMKWNVIDRQSTDKTVTCQRAQNIEIDRITKTAMHAYRWMWLMLLRHSHLICCCCYWPSLSWLLLSQQISRTYSTYGMQFVLVKFISFFQYLSELNGRLLHGWLLLYDYNMWCYYIYSLVHWQLCVRSWSASAAFFDNFSNSIYVFFLYFFLSS